MIAKIRKRDGSIVDFEKSKIAGAIFKAARAVGGKDRREAERLADFVMIEVENLGEKVPSVEEIQDIVEKVLIENGHAVTAKAYILYRQERSALREQKMLVMEKDNLDDVDKEAKQRAFEIEEFNADEYDEKFSIGKYKLNQYHMDGVRRLYERMNRNKQMKVSWSQFMDLLDKGYFNKYEKSVEEFYELMTKRKFMPNTPAIANFGNALGMGSACFVLDVPDSIEGIMETLKNTAVVFKAGGGMGYNFSKLRPEGDFVSTTGGVASGPISFMRLFDTMTEVIKQGGIRRGANMGILNSNHPDIEKFITAKDGNKSLRNFNISVLIMPDFWEHYEKNEPYPLVNPKDGTVVKTVNPRVLFDKIVYQAWEYAEPGVIFFDKVNDYNPFLEHLGPIVTTNPCGEVLLYPNEPCNLGSINVWAFARQDEEGNSF